MGNDIFPNIFPGPKFDCSGSRWFSVHKAFMFLLPSNLASHTFLGERCSREIKKCFLDGDF